MWSDNETHKDFLGYQVHSELLQRIILNDSLLPITIGVFGNWGSGKSSLMLLLEDGIKKWVDEIEKVHKSRTNSCQDNVKILQIKFNSWQFETYDSTKLTMIETILESLKKDITQRRTLFDKVDALLAHINFLEAGVFILKKASQLLPNQIKELLPNKEELDKILENDKYNTLIDSVNKGNTSKFIEHFRTLFEELVISANYKVVVVYIDDLDRCDPKRIIECLEAVKLFVNVKRTAFVIGADERIIEYAIQQHYPIEQKKEEISSPFSDYLEKLIQLPYKLPKLSDNEQETYITLLLCKYYLNTKNGFLFDKVYEKYTQFRQKDKHSKFNIDDIKEVIPRENLSMVEYMLGIVPIIKNFLNGNPRQLKRFMNTMDVRLQLANVAGFTDIRPDILVKLMVLEYNTLHISRFEDLYKRQKEGNGYIEFSVVEEQAMTEEGIRDASWKDAWDSPFLKRWLASKPSLQNINLQDYFWVARDALKNEIPIASVVTNRVMLLYKQLSVIQTITTMKTRLPSIINSMTEEEVDMIILLLNRSLKTDVSNQNCWNILNGDENNMLFSDHIDRLKFLLNGIDLEKIPPAASSFFARLKQLGEPFHKYVDSIVNVNTKLSKAINIKTK